MNARRERLARHTAAIRAEIEVSLKVVRVTVSRARVARTAAAILRYLARRGPQAIPASAVGAKPDTTCVPAGQEPRQESS